MQIIRGFDSLPAIDNLVATVGSYDGVHLGHKVLLDTVIERAKCRNGRSMVITFEPHPRITLKQDAGLKLLTTMEEKAQLLEAVGIDYMLVVNFDEAFSRLTHQQFVDQYLIGKLGLSELVIGYNHHFGHNKSGDYGYLTAQKPTLTVTRVEQQLIESHKVSSTVIRACIDSGDMTTARKLLGHRYIVTEISDSNGIIAPNRYKLLPPDGKYQAIVNGEEQYVTITNGVIACLLPSQQITIEL